MKYRGKGFTNQQLVTMQATIEADPKNQNPKGHINRFTPQAQKKLAAIAQAITDNIIEQKKASGTYVFTGGYSGRQTNRR